LDVIIQGSGKLVPTGRSAGIVAGIVGRLKVGGSRTQGVGVITALEVGQNGRCQQYQRD